jgi:general secretion pathway protein A
MEHDRGLRIETGQWSGGEDHVPAVRSRRQALDRLLATVESGATGSVLITGEPGAGKTWLSRQLASELPSRWRVARVDLTRTMVATDFLELVGQALELSSTGRLGSVRAELHATLHDEALDGRRWLLVIDEAHRGLPAIWDEIQVFLNYLGRPGGVAALLVVGDTELARAVASRRLSGFASSLSAHIHLMPLDLDEARELLAVSSGYRHEAQQIVEEIHRDARGNPSALLRLAQRWRDRLPRRLDFAATSERRQEVPPNSGSQSSFAAEPYAAAGAEELEIGQPMPANGIAPALAANVGIEAPSLIPTKPPIRLEEGLVEVGWDGDLEAEVASHSALSAGISTAVLPDDSAFNEELVEDRYASLQAWNEWTKTQQDLASTATTTDGSLVTPSAEPSSGSDRQKTDKSPGSLEHATAGTSGIRAESQHEFAPYSQLFNRLRQSKQP